MVRKEARAPDVARHRVGGEEPTHALELLGPHANVCLVNDEPALRAQGVDEAADEFAVEVKRLGVNSFEEK